MPINSNHPAANNLEARIAKAESAAETARRRATMALKYTREALHYSASTPRVGAMIREIEDELKND